jgi:hypothetical protein
MRGEMRAGKVVCVRGVNNALTMSEVEHFILGVDLFIIRKSLFSHLSFIGIEMKIADREKRGVLFGVGQK